MEKNKLDKLFQDKFAGREFEFQNSYWEETEAMIAAAEAGKQKRVLGWIIGMGCLLLIAGLSWFFLQNDGGEAVAETLDKNATIIESSATIIESDEDSNLREIEAGNGINLSLNLGKIKADRLKGAVGETDDLNKEFAIKEAGEIIKSNAGFDKESNFKNKIATGKKSINTLKSVDDKGVKNADLKSLLPESKPVNPILNKTKDQQSPDISNENKPIATKPVFKEEKITANLIELYTDFSLLKWQNSLHRSLQNVTIDTSLYPLKRHCWNLQATIGGSVIPISKANDIGVNNVFGGLIIGYRITPGINLQTGLNYKIVQADFDRTEISRQVSYGFGKQDDVFYGKAHNLHFIEMPILVRYTSKKSQISIGLNIGKLIAAKGEVTAAKSNLPSERTDSENAGFYGLVLEARDNGMEKPVFREDASSEISWLEIADFKPFQLSVTGKYELTVSSKFSMGMGFDYRLNKEYLKNGMGDYSALSVQLFTSYRIFN
jgi:hypothetical protein